MPGKRGETHMQVCWHVTRDKRDSFRVTIVLAHSRFYLAFSLRILHLAYAFLRANAVQVNNVIIAGSDDNDY
jgi:hypothetical protein